MTTTSLKNQAQRQEQAQVWAVPLSDGISAGHIEAQWKFSGTYGYFRFHLLLALSFPFSLFLNPNLFYRTKAMG